MWQGGRISAVVIGVRESRQPGEGILARIMEVSEYKTLKSRSASVACYNLKVCHSHGWLRKKKLR
jgi:hypothetical protein